MTKPTRLRFTDFFSFINNTFRPGAAGPPSLSAQVEIEKDRRGDGAEQ